MKKFFVSSVVIVAFVAYSLYQRILGTQAISFAVPQTVNNTLSNKSQNTSTDTPSPTPTPTSPPTPTQAPPTAVIPTPTPTPKPTQNPGSPYKDGSYSGDQADAFYGYIQVQATISSGKITNVQFLQYPNDRETSIMINSQADPMLAQEAIQAQSAQVDIISGATDSSQAFIQSMQSALDKAKS